MHAIRNTQQNISIIDILINHLIHLMDMFDLVLWKHTFSPINPPMRKSIVKSNPSPFFQQNHQQLIILRIIHFICINKREIISAMIFLVFDELFEILNRIYEL